MEVDSVVKGLVLMAAMAVFSEATGLILMVVSFSSHSSRRVFEGHAANVGDSGEHSGNHSDIQGIYVLF